MWSGIPVAFIAELARVNAIKQCNWLRPPAGVPRYVLYIVQRQLIFYRAVPGT